MKKLSLEAEKQIRDIIKRESGPELILERRGGAFTFDVDVKSEEEWKSKGDAPKRFVKPNKAQSNRMEVDMAGNWSNRFEALWNDEPNLDEMECMECNPGFPRR